MSAKCCCDVTTADAGDDQIVALNTLVQLDGNRPTNGCGIWSLVSGSGTLVNRRRYDAQVKNIGEGANVFKWTIRKCGCKCETTSEDSVTITAS